MTKNPKWAKTPGVFSYLHSYWHRQTRIHTHTHTDKQTRTRTDTHKVSTAAVPLFPYTHLAVVKLPGVTIESRISAPHSSMVFISLPLVLPVGVGGMEGVRGGERAHARKR